MRTRQAARGNPYNLDLWGLYYYPRDGTAIVPLPLLNVRVEASLKELAAQVKLTHTYGNDADVAIEAIYSFPIPVRAAVCSFVMVKQDGTRVIGRIEEKTEAREKYETAISQGKQAALMEQESPDVFKIAVGNIQPEEQVQIELIYATTLSEDEDNDSIRFHLPVHIGARYGQAPTTEFTGHNWTHFWPSKSTFLEISVNVEAASRLSSDPILPFPTLRTFHSQTMPVSLSSESALDKDFVLTVKSAGLDAPRCVAELHPIHPTVALALTIVPRFKLPDLARQEFILLIDRSGSMSGQRIEAAKKALIVMLRSLPAKDSLFQIASFGNGCTTLWDEGSRPYNQATLDDATRHVDGMQADYGGTEIRGALQQCFETRKTDRPTTVFLLTDGEAWDVDRVLNEVKGAVARAPTQAYLRVSVLGIGNSVSTAMCEGIARVGNGTCMMVGQQETTFTGKIARMLKAARTPMISDISVDWGVPVFEVAKPPDGIDEEDTFVMVSDEENGSVKGKGKQKEKATLNIFDKDVDPMQVDPEPVPAPPEVVLSPAPPVQQSPFKVQTLSPGIRLNVYAILQGKTVPKTSDAPPAIHALAARAIIQDLEDGRHAIAIDDVDLLSCTARASIVRLGKEYSISSSQTSFVAVNESAQSTTSVRRSGRLRQPDVIAIPIIVMARTSGRGGRGGRGTRVVGGGKAARKQLATSAARKTANAALSQPSIPAAAAAPTAARARKKRKVEVEKFFDFAGVSDDDDDDESSGPAAALMDPLEALARVQSFDGCFSLAVLPIVQLNMDVVEARTALLEGVSDEVFATILAMAFLSTKLGPDVERESWEAMYDKARVFVEGALQLLGTSVDVGELEAKAIVLLA
ncbi:von Willebrand factor type A domain-containing protein [Mycena rosella]|uniref:von Willebrand factor type A domain-containing protein n=1 Tax=Mycena rosella TaxID=1033263 RepID=A0AAD7D7B2_MYCRO|nr:von Willebrand factor type A domain-containing protein [Mycena rosella]